jgi:dihydrofolate reductase
MAYSIEDAIEKMDIDKENFIIGGGSVYRQFLPLAQQLYLTIVQKDFEADTFLEIDLSDWEIVAREDHPEEELPYYYLNLKRK